MIWRILGVACAVAAFAGLAASAEAAPIAAIKTVKLAETIGFRTAYDGNFVYWVRTARAKERFETGDDSLLRTSILDGSTVELYRASKAQHENITGLEVGGGVVAFTLADLGGLDVADEFADYQGFNSKIMRIKGDGSPATIVASGTINPDSATVGGFASAKKLDDCGTFAYLSDVTSAGEIVYADVTRERNAPVCGSLPNRNRVRYLRVSTDDTVNEIFTSVTKIHAASDDLGGGEFELFCNCAAGGVKNVKIEGTFALVFDAAGGQLIDLTTGVWTKKFSSPGGFNYDFFGAPDPSLDAAGHVVAKFMLWDDRGAPNHKLRIPSSKPVLYPVAADSGVRVKLKAMSKPVFCGGRLISLIRNRASRAVLSELNPATGARLRTIGVLPDKGSFGMAACNSQYLFTEVYVARAKNFRDRYVVRAIPLG